MVLNEHRQRGTRLRPPSIGLVRTGSELRRLCRRHSGTSQNGAAEEPAPPSRIRAESSSVTLKPQAAVWICVCAAQRCPRWKIADGNDLLRGLVKKKLLDHSRKEIPNRYQPIHQSAKASNKSSNFSSRLIDQNHCLSHIQQHISRVTATTVARITSTWRYHISARQDRHNGCQTRNYHLSRA